jgi:dipicolinate synthase subunit B
MKTAGFAITGSFCTFDDAIPQMEKLKAAGFDIVPIMSQIAYETDTRFGLAENFRNKVKEITGRDIIHTIFDAEPIGPKSLLDILVIAPATGNTMSKIANGINDTPVTMAAKAHLRNGKPVVIAAATNDALSAAAQNIGRLFNVKNIYFVPMQQDDIIKKPTSLIADFEQIVPTVEAALQGKQLQPVFY